MDLISIHQKCSVIQGGGVAIQAHNFTFHKQWQSKVNCLFEVQRAVGQHLGFQAKTLHPTGTLCKIESAQRAFGSKLQSRGYCSDLQSRDYCTNCCSCTVLNPRVIYVCSKHSKMLCVYSLRMVVAYSAQRARSL